MFLLGIQLYSIFGKQREKKTGFPKTLCRLKTTRLRLPCTLKCSPIHRSLLKSESLSLSTESFQESNRCHSRQPGCTWRSRGQTRRVCCVYTHPCVISQKMLCPQKTLPKPPPQKKKIALDHRDKQTMERPRPNKNTAPRLAAPYLLRSNGTFRGSSASLSHSGPGIDHRRARRPT